MLVSDIEKAVFRLHALGRYQLQKWQKNLQIADILMQFEPTRGKPEPVCLSNEVFSPFVILQPSILMMVPEKSHHEKPENA